MGRDTSPVIEAGPTPEEGLALTRLVLAFCMGRGCLSKYSRSLNLQIRHPINRQEYADYQWRRLLQVLPDTRRPQRVGPETGTQWWRLRVGSRYFEPAYNLLYGPGDGRGVAITREMLQLVGGEGIACLWADRGRIISSRSRRVSGGPHERQGLIHLSRATVAEAHVVAQWIAALTGAQCEVAPNARQILSPVLILDYANLKMLLEAMERSWHAQSQCLWPLFNLERD